MSTIDLTTGLAKLPEILGEVQFAILYGSAATGTMREDSDIDLAVMYPSPLTPEELLRLVRDVAAAFGRGVDILDLVAAGPIVKMQVLRYGRPVVVNDPGALQRFQMYTPGEYFDFKRQRRAIEEALVGEGGPLENMKFDEDILLAKTATVRRCTGLIRRLWFDNDPAVPAWVCLDVTVLNLQRAVEACLDMANHLIAANSWDLPASADDAIDTLVDNRVVPASQARVYRAMIGFRNIAVHNYAEIDETIVEGIVNDHLEDLDRFAAGILKGTLGLEGERSSLPAGASQ